MWNRAAEQHSQYSAAEAVGRYLSDFIREESRSVVLASLADSQNRRFFESSILIPLISKSGDTIPMVLVQLASLLNPQGALMGVLCIGQKASAYLQQEREYERLVENFR